MMTPTGPAAQRGYILIYVLSVLLFLAGVVAGVMYALRVDAQSVFRQREQLRAELRLHGALEYALAQFALERAAAARPRGGERDAPAAGWRFEPSEHRVQIDGTEVTIEIEDPGGVADLNSLDERMWADYFTALGLVQPEQARTWAGAVIEWKTQVGKANGRGGFTSIDDLLALDVLPASVRYGGWAAAQADEEVPPLPGLPELFLAGPADRVLDANRAALPLVAAFAGARPEQLAAYSAARRGAKISAADAVRLLGPRAQPLFQDARQDFVVRAVLATSAGANRLALVAYLRRQENAVQLLSLRVQPVAAPEQRRAGYDGRRDSQS